MSIDRKAPTQKQIPIDLLPPLKPPMKDHREPFYNIEDAGDELRVYIELPGADEGEIELKAEQGKLNLEARKFRTRIDRSRVNSVSDYLNLLVGRSVDRII